MIKKTAINNLLPGEAYSGQRKELKKRDEQIYKQRISEGTTYRELGIKHGGLSGERVRVIIARQARARRRRAKYAAEHLAKLKKNLDELIEAYEMMNYLDRRTSLKGNERVKELEAESKRLKDQMLSNDLA